MTNLPFQDELLPLGKVVIRSEGEDHAIGINHPLAMLHGPGRIGCRLAQTSNTLQPPSAFVSISDASERSRAIFTEAAKASRIRAA